MLITSESRRSARAGSFLLSVFGALAWILVLGDVLPAQSSPELPGVAMTAAEEAVVSQAIEIYKKAIELAKEDMEQPAPKYGFTDADIKRMEAALKSFQKAKAKGRVRTAKSGQKGARTHPEREDKDGGEVNTPEVGVGGEGVTIPPKHTTTGAPQQAVLAVVVGHEGERLTASQRLVRGKKPVDMTDEELEDCKKAFDFTVSICVLDRKVISALMDYYDGKNTLYWVNLRNHKRTVMVQEVKGRELSLMVAKEQLRRLIEGV
jgi:tetratricopeptide (TPR) repeat protein